MSKLALEYLIMFNSLSNMMFFFFGGTIIMMNYNDNMIWYSLARLTCQNICCLFAYTYLYNKYSNNENIGWFRYHHIWCIELISGIILIFIYANINEYNRYAYSDLYYLLIFKIIYTFGLFVILIIMHKLHCFVQDIILDNDNPMYNTQNNLHQHFLHDKINIVV